MGGLGEVDKDHSQRDHAWDQEAKKNTSWLQKIELKMKKSKDCIKTTMAENCMDTYEIYKANDEILTWCISFSDFFAPSLLLVAVKACGAKGSTGSFISE